MTVTSSIHLRTNTPSVGTLDQIRDSKEFDTSDKPVFKPMGPMVVYRVRTNLDLFFRYFGQQSYTRTAETCLHIAFVFNICGSEHHAL